MFDDTRDFIQAHFYFAPRDDTPFWRANKELHARRQHPGEDRDLQGRPADQPADHRRGRPTTATSRPSSATSGPTAATTASSPASGCLPDQPLAALAYKPDSVQRARSRCSPRSSGSSGNWWRRCRANVRVPAAAARQEADPGPSARRIRPGALRPTRPFARNPVRMRPP